MREQGFLTKMLSAKVRCQAFLSCVRNSQISFAAYSSMGFKCCAAGVEVLNLGGGSD